MNGRPLGVAGSIGRVPARVSMMYQGDAQLHLLWSEALAARELTDGLTGNEGRNAVAVARAYTINARRVASTCFPSRL